VTSATSLASIAATSAIAIAVPPVPTIATASTNVTPSGRGVERVHAGHRHLGVAPTRHAEVGHHPPSEPRRIRRIHPRTHCVDGAGHLPSRGHRELGKRERSAGAASPDRRVDQVDACRRHGDAHLTRGRLRVGDLVVAEDLWRPEVVLPDGVPSGGHALVEAPADHPFRMDVAGEDKGSHGSTIRPRVGPRTAGDRVHGGAV
jgi:hypothetical protein